MIFVICYYSSLSVFLTLRKISGWTETWPCVSNTNSTNSKHSTAWETNNELQSVWTYFLQIRNLFKETKATGKRIVAIRQLHFYPYSEYFSEHDMTSYDIWIFTNICYCLLLLSTSETGLETEIIVIRRVFRYMKNNNIWGAYCTGISVLLCVRTF